MDRLEKVDFRLLSGRLAPSEGRLLLLALEYAVLFFGLPAVLWFGVLRLPQMTLLYIFTAVALAALVWDRHFDRRGLYSLAAWRKEALPLLFRFAIAAGVMTLVMALRHADELFLFATSRPQVLGRILIMYALMSALPQEIIYRAYFFNRYAPLFPGRWLLVANVAAFVALHVIYLNWLAVVLTIPAGIIFAQTYQRTRSLPLVALEHALYGGWIFTVGLGIYFVN